MRIKELYFKYSKRWSEIGYNRREEIVTISFCGTCFILFALLI